MLTRMDEGAGSTSAQPSTELSSAAKARATIKGVVILQIAANALGVAAVAAYFHFLYPLPTTEEIGDVDLNVVIFGIYVGLMGVIALPVNAMLLRRAVIWAREGTPPTERQRKLLFSLPLAETLSALLSWFGAAVLFGLLNRGSERIAIGIALAGMVTCALLYLLLEGYFRPVYALALEDAKLPEDRRDVLPRLMLAWVLGSGVPLVGIAMTTVIVPGPLEPHRLAWIAGVSFVAGGLVMGVAARSVARPLTRVRDAMRQIERGELDTHVPVDDLGELGRLAEGVNNLGAGIREREQLRDLFGRQVGQHDFADLALGGWDPATASSRRDVTVLFVDLIGYTRFSESHSPEEVVDMLNQFFRVVVAVVNREGGWINKFEGDAAMCIFGAPQDQPDHADRALRTAAALPREMAHVDGLLDAGTGVASGEVIAGFVGTPERFEYTVIGDVVNLASRLCDEAKEAGVPVLASESTIRRAVADDGWVSHGRLSLKGRSGKVSAYTLRTAQVRRSRRYGTPWSSRAERSAP